MLYATQFKTAIAIGSAILASLNLALFISSEEYRVSFVAASGPSAAADLLAQDVNVVYNVTRSIINVGAATIATAQSASEIARSFQGNTAYPGVDRFRDIIIKKGAIIYTGEPGVIGFFTTGKSIERAGGDATKLFEGLQVRPLEVVPGVGLYRPGVTAYEVLEDSPAAFGIVRANSQYGNGGFPQIYIPDWEQKVKPIVSYPLGNRVKLLPGD